MYLAPTATSSTEKPPLIPTKATRTLKFRPRTAEEEKKLLVRSLYQEVSFRLAVTAQNIQDCRRESEQPKKQTRKLDLNQVVSKNLESGKITIKRITVPLGKKESYLRFKNEIFHLDWLLESDYWKE